MIPASVDAAVARMRRLEAELSAGGDPVAIHVQACAALAIMASWAGDDPGRRRQVDKALTVEQVELAW